MKAFNFLKLCRSTNISTLPLVIPQSPKVVHDESDEDDNESSFDLDITSFGQNKENTNMNTQILQVPCDNNIVQYKAKQPKIHQPKVSSDKRKIIPIDQPSRPQSPIGLFKGSPSFWFRKAKSMEVQRTEQSKPARESKVKIRKSLSDNFKLEDVASFRKEYNDKMKQKAEESSFKNKYLNFFKPGNEKNVVKKKSGRMSVSGYNSEISSPASYTPRKEGNSNQTFIGIRMSSRSSTPRAPASSPVIVRTDDSAREKQDGIQGAIMHCKLSFNNSPSNVY